MQSNGHNKPFGLILDILAKVFLVNWDQVITNTFFQFHPVRYKSLKKKNISDWSIGSRSVRQLRHSLSDRRRSRSHSVGWSNDRCLDFKKKNPEKSTTFDRTWLSRFLSIPKNSEVKFYNENFISEGRSFENRFKSQRKCSIQTCAKLLMQNGQWYIKTRVMISAEAFRICN